MTGGEIAAVGKAVEVVGRKAFAEDEKTNASLLRMAEDTPEMRAAARSKAARIAVKERVKLKLYQPFARMLGVSKEYFEDIFPQEMGAKIADIPDDDLITPSASIAVPALQGLSYTFGEPDLKEMYLNLLATASDARRIDQAHPAFAEIIKQLAPEEVGLLTWMFKRPGLPVARVRDELADVLTSPGVLLSPMFPIGYRATDDPEEKFPLSAWVDNWQRLGLVDITFVELSTLDGEDWIKRNPDYIRFSNLPGVTKIAFDKGMIRITHFGRRFYRAVADT